MIKIFVLIILIFIISCGYPDIDTVPSFDELNLTEEESIDLCKLSSTDTVVIDKCIESLNYKNK